MESEMQVGVDEELRGFISMLTSPIMYSMTTPQIVQELRALVLPTKAANILKIIDRCVRYGLGNGGAITILDISWRRHCEREGITIEQSLQDTPWRGEWEAEEERARKKLMDEQLGKLRLETIQARGIPPDQMLLVPNLVARMLDDSKEEPGLAVVIQQLKDTTFQAEEAPEDPLVTQETKVP